MARHPPSNQRRTNVKKCFWSDFNLQYDSNGTPSIRAKTIDDNQLHLTNLDGTKVTLNTTQPSKGIRHLGVHISMDGNMQAETKILFKRCQVFQQVYTNCPFTRREAKVTYSTVYLPTITYPFLATTLPLKTLEKAQSMTTPLILSKMGYNRNMPKAVVYAPSTHGGIGMKHLFTGQGLSKVLHLMKHFRAKTTLGTLMNITIKAYQLQAGIPEPILEDTTQLPWMPNRWINNLRAFLYEIGGKIQLEDPWTILKLREHDRHLMQDFLLANLSNTELTKLNNCRLYLQVTTLAEITDHTGTKLLDTNITSRHKTPDLKNVSVSLLRWPTQPNPGNTAWTLWTRTLQKLYTKPGMATQLKRCLGPWQPQAAAYRKWHTTYNQLDQTIITTIPEQPTASYPKYNNTRSHLYYQNPQVLLQETHTSSPVTIEQQ